MTKLEQEIFSALGDAIETLDDDMNGEYEAYAKAAAEVAKKYIEKGLSDAFNQAHYSVIHSDVVKRIEYNEWALEWLKENGVT